MTRPRRLCVVTDTRAEYGLLRWSIQDISNEPAFELPLIVTGMYLAPEFGSTVTETEADGFEPFEHIEMLVAGDTGSAVAKSIGLGIVGFADAFARFRPDPDVLLGDRFEISAAAQTALVMRIPTAHIAGGDSTEGAFDEDIRHSNTKLSGLHLVTNEIAAACARQMGEDINNIHVVGSQGSDDLRSMPLLSRETLEEELDCSLLERNILVIYHPETLGLTTSISQFMELLHDLDELGPKVYLLFTYPNADAGGRALISLIEDFVATHANAHGFASLGQLRYLSLMKFVDVVVGNSSNGLYEAPSFHVPTVNIGDRQTGRLKANSVIDCAADRQSIQTALTRAFSLDCSQVENPYGDGRSSAQIVSLLRLTKDYPALTRKQFTMAGITS